MKIGLILFTLLHVLISLVAIFTGVVVLCGLIRSERLDRWTAIFLTATVATSLTGFLFPYHGITPAVATGAISMMFLLLTIYARYSRRLSGGWSKVYVIGAVTALYLNVFVLIVQLFLKVPFLIAMAPNQNEPPFAITQLFVFGVFFVLGVVAVRNFHGGSAQLKTEVKI